MSKECSVVKRVIKLMERFFHKVTDNQMRLSAQSSRCSHHDC
jgi:hypothetical protein